MKVKYKENIVINQGILLEISEVSKKEFNNFRIYIEKFWPEYQNRDRKKYILNKIGGIIGNEKLGMELFTQSNKILDKFWDLIKDSKDDVIAGLVIGLSIMCSKYEDVTLSSICKFLHISQGSLLKSIQTKLFNRHGIKNNLKGFKKKVEFLEEIGFFKDL